MKNKNPENELLLKVHRIKNDQGEWMPAIEDVSTHDITPMWVAGVAYAIFDRYISSVDDSRQAEFQEEAAQWLILMLQDDESQLFTDKMKKPDSME